MISLTESNLEYAAYANLKAWLATFFDGNNHAIGANPAEKFPFAVCAAGQSALPQPLAKALPTGMPATTPVLGISMVFGAEPGQSRGIRWTMVDGVRQQVVYRRVRLMFYLRSETATNEARLLILKAGDQLYALLGNAAATYPLTQLGMIRWQPGRPQPGMDTSFITAQLSCLVTLKYNVLLTQA
jgi:hypothetical protein